MAPAAIGPTPAQAARFGVSIQHVAPKIIRRTTLILSVDVTLTMQVDRSNVCG